jgi:general secretion pathway protein F
MDFEITLRETTARARAHRIVLSVKTPANIDAAARRYATREHLRVVRIKRMSKAPLRLSAQDRFVLLTRLSAMLRARVGLSDALALIARTFRGGIQRTAERLGAYVRGGKPLDEALSALGPGAFPRASVAVIQAGYRAGNAARALSDAATFETLLSKARESAGKGLGSAIVGFVIGEVFLVSGTYWLGPQLLKQGLMGTYKNIIHIGPVYAVAHGVTIVSIVLFAVVFFAFLLPSALRPVFPAAMDRLLARIPYARDIALARVNYVAYYSLARLIESGVRLEDAMTYSAESTPRSAVREDLLSARDAVRRGEPWPQRLRSAHPTDRAAMSVATDRQSLVESLSAIADQYRDLYAHRLAMAVPALQTLAAILLTAAGGVIFGEMFLPFLQVIRHISGGI